MSNKSNPSVATMGIDIGKNSFHVVGLARALWAVAATPVWIVDGPLAKASAALGVGDAAAP